MSKVTATNHIPTSPREALAQSAAKFPRHEALHIPATACAHYASEGNVPAAISLSYEKLEAAVTRGTEICAGTGINGRVALVLENRVDFFVQWLALNALGISVIPINHEMPDEEIPYYLEHGEAVAICALAEHVERLTDISSSLETPLPVVSPQ